MKIIESIRNYFAPAYSNKYANPIEDAKLLSAIGGEGEFICARNGKSYFYYAPYDARNMDVAQYLLRRNGVRASRHFSKYYCPPETVLRAPRREIEKRPETKHFVESIYVYKKPGADYDTGAMLKLVRAQMMGKQVR